MENKIFFSNLKDEVMFLASQSDEVIVISGYVGPITIEELAQKCPKTTVVYGMYGRDGISSYLHKALCLLSASHNDLKILYSTSGTHTKCYIFFKEKKNQTYTRRISEFIRTRIIKSGKYRITYLSV